LRTSGIHRLRRTVCEGLGFTRRWIVFRSELTVSSSPGAFGDCVAGALAGFKCPSSRFSLIWEARVLPLWDRSTSEAVSGLSTERAPPIKGPELIRFREQNPARTWFPRENTPPRLIVTHFLIKWDTTDGNLQFLFNPSLDLGASRPVR
jgi:hypothetical protein